MSNRRHRLAPAVVAGVVVSLVGCTPGAPQPSPPAVNPTTAGPSPGPVESEYRGPLPMPASDGQAMLWPTTTTRTLNLQGGDVEQIRHGFVDSTGALVVPPRYEQFEYCRDRNGRATLVLASSAEDHSDILDLSGQVIGTVPGRLVSCIGDTHAEFQTAASELGPLEVGSGLFDLRSGEVVIPVEKGRVVSMIDRRTVNVHEAGGEYFLDLVTGERTPHPGYLTGSAGRLADERDAAPVPATAIAPEVAAEEALPVGYLDRSGKWALEPSLAGAEPFQAGYAVVTAGAAAYLIDTDFRRATQDWARITPLEWGYAVTEQSGGGGLTGLLGLDLRVIVEPVEGEIDCGWDPDGACGIYPRSGPPRLLLLPELIVTDLPAGFTRVLSRTLFTDAVGDAPATRVHDAATGLTFTLERPSSCSAAGGWISCQPVEQGAPRAVYSATGVRTALREVEIVEDAVAGTDSGYFWAVAGRYQGFIDHTGSWHYREHRYTELED